MYPHTRYALLLTRRHVPFLQLFRERQGLQRWAETCLSWEPVDDEFDELETLERMSRFHGCDEFWIVDSIRALIQAVERYDGLALPGQRVDMTLKVLHDAEQEEHARSHLSA